MSPRECFVRSAQVATKLSERLAGIAIGEMSDAALQRIIDPRRRSGSALSAAASVLGRIRSATEPGSIAAQTFFSAIKRRSEITEIMRRRFSADREALIERAERAMQGRFDLLGLADISFGPEIDWRLEPVSGRRTPLNHWSTIDYLNADAVGDKKLTWELNRCGHFVTFGQAYLMTGDERYAQAFVRQAVCWIESNPPKLGINWASSLEVAYRAISWLWALHFFAQSPNVTPEFVLRFLKTLAAHGRHIETYLSEYFSPNTHLTGEALGLVYLGTALPELRCAERWRRTGIRILLEQLPIQVRSDGVYFEQSTYYHRYTTDIYTHLAVLSRELGLSSSTDVDDKLVKLLDHLMWITQPDGSTPLVGDDDGGRLLNLAHRKHDDFRDTLAVGAALFGRGDWKLVAGEPPVELLWLLGPDGLGRYDRIRKQHPRETARAFEAGGYYVIRDGWSPQSSCVLMDCGPHGGPAAGHAHSDALAFEYAASGQTWLIDPGTFTYTADRRLRDEFRATAAHNTVVVDDKPQSLPDAVFSWKHVAQSSLVDFWSNQNLAAVQGRHSGYERLNDPVTHTRELVFVRSGGKRSPQEQLHSYLMICDRFAARDLHRYTIRYHLSPECTAVASGNRILAAQPKDRRLSIVMLSKLVPEVRVSEGWVSRSYGHREPALVAEFEFDAEGYQEFTTFIVPSLKDHIVDIEEQSVPDRRARGYRISSGSTYDIVLRTDSDDIVQCGPLAAEASLAWGRFVNRKLVRACLAHGRSLEAADGFSLSSRSALRNCAVVRSNDRVDFWVQTSEATALEQPSLVINDTAFQITRQNQRMVMEHDGQRWRLTNLG
jgi:heparinase II/III-like protein